MWVLACATLAQPEHRGLHVGPQGARKGRLSAPQCVVGNLADWPKQVETTDVRAERTGGVGRTLTVTGQVLGMRVGRVDAVEGGVKDGWLVW